MISRMVIKWSIHLYFASSSSFNFIKYIHFLNISIMSPIDCLNIGLNNFQFVFRQQTSFEKLFCSRAFVNSFGDHFVKEISLHFVHRFWNTEWVNHSQRAFHDIILRNAYIDAWHQIKSYPKLPLEPQIDKDLAKIFALFQK